MKISSKYIITSFVILALTGFGVRTTVNASEETHNAHQHGHEEHDDSNEETGDEQGHKDESSESHKGHEDHETPGEHEGHDDHEDHSEEEVIKLDEEARSMIQLQTEPVRSRKLGGKLEVYGKIAQDTENYSYVTFGGEGRIEKIYVRLGTIVDKGDPLISIRRDDGSVEDVLSDMHGAVLSIFVKPGERVDRLTSLLSIIDVDTMRATIDIYEKDLRYVHVGQKVILTTSAFPDKEFNGEVVYISPQVDEHTQSIKVRVDVENHEHLLRLGMFLSGKLIYASDKKALAVPVSAVQQLNEKDIVFAAEKEDIFKLKEVELGQRSNEYVEVKKGLKEGDVVVTQGSFYLKSERAKEAFGDGHGH